MNAGKLIDPDRDGEHLAAYCGSCGKVYPFLGRKNDSYSIDMADKCCVMPSCIDCGKEGRSHSLRCFKCQEKNRIANIPKVSWQDYAGAVFYDERLHNSIEDCVDWICENADGDPIAVPEFLVVAKQVHWDGIDIERLLECEVQDTNVEDINPTDMCDDLDELTKFIKAWNAKQTYSWFEEDRSLIVDMSGFKWDLPNEAAS